MRKSYRLFGIKVFEIELGKTDVEELKEKIRKGEVQEIMDSLLKTVSQPVLNPMFHPKEEDTNPNTMIENIMMDQIRKQREEGKTDMEELKEKIRKGEVQEIMDSLLKTMGFIRNNEETTKKKVKRKAK